MEVANDLLQNGILVATTNGVVCMSLTDALKSNLNLTVEDFKTVAEKLVLDEGKTRKLTQFDCPPFTSDCTLDSDDPISDSGVSSIAGSSTEQLKPSDNLNTVSDSDASSAATSTYQGVNLKVATVTVDNALEANKIPAKRRGGWPKGRKRKPELLHLPPKAPATGYNLYLNDIRKQFKGSKLAFHEITKIIGNRWSSLSLEQKQPYLERAEQDKCRYREELRVYRESGAYQLYLAKKRRKRVQNNVLSESDMDATDDIDDEDNEELYCRTCDQWFHNLHNKREHLQGRQHIQAMVGDMRSELGSDYGTDTGGDVSVSSFNTSLDQSSLHAIASTSTAKVSNREDESVSQSMTNLITAITQREKEYKTLKMRTEEAKAAHDALYQQLCSLKDRETILKNELDALQNGERNIEIKLFQLWQVPSLFVTTDLNSDCLDGSEYLTDE